jgi:plastocyanin
MHRHLRSTLLAVASLLGAAFVLAPSVAAGDPCYHGYTIPPATSAETSTVRLDPCAFLPTNAHVASGSTVTFTNGSGQAHLLTGANAAWGDRDKEIPDGASVTVTFDKPGIYPYSCALHRGMSGAIVVDGVSGSDARAAASTTPPPGDGPLAALAIAGFAVLAAAGWAVALLQRRSPPLAAAPVPR